MITHYRQDITWSNKLQMDSGHKQLKSLKKTALMYRFDHRRTKLINIYQVSNWLARSLSGIRKEMFQPRRLRLNLIATFQVPLQYINVLVKIHQVNICSKLKDDCLIITISIPVCVV